MTTAQPTVEPGAMPALGHVPVLSVRDLDVDYTLSGGQRMRAVDRVSFVLWRWD